MWEKYKAFRSNVRAEFEDLIAPLLRNQQVRDLDRCMQHYNYTRLQHSVDVAYLSFFFTKLLGWRSRETARAALLHDLFFHAEGQNSRSLMLSHPVIAVGNARKICTLTPLEENIILRHMWLLTLIPPKYKEGFVVTFVDKFCASREFIVSVLSRSKRRAYFSA